MKLLLKTLWAFSLILFSATYAFGQDVYTIRQDDYNDRKIFFDMVDATDGYTAETGLTPTCTILKPLASAFTSCANAVVEIGSGKYRLIVSPLEVQNIGFGSLYITNAGARPARINFEVVGDGRSYKVGTDYFKSHSNLNNAAWFNKTGVTVTEDSTNDYLGSATGDTITGDGANSKHMVAAPMVDPGGSGEIYLTAEVKSGTLNNAWIGNDSASHIWGVDINTSTGAITPNTDGRLRGWKVEQLASSWWRVHLLATERPTDGAVYSIVVALGNGTASNNAPTFTTSGTMIATRVKVFRAEDVEPKLIESLLPDLQSASSATSVTLSGSDTSTSSMYVNRELCVLPGYIASSYARANTSCSCIASYDGSTKVATLSPALPYVPSATAPSTYKYRIGNFCTPQVATVVHPTVAGSSTGAFKLANSTYSVGNLIQGREACIISGTGVGQCRCIRAFDAAAATQLGYVSPSFQTAPDATSTIMLRGYCNSTVTRIDDDVVTSNSIATDAIGSAEIASSAINASEIGSNAIGADEIATSAITQSKIGDNTLSTAKFVAGAIDATVLGDNAITSAKIATDTIGSSEVATSAVTEIVTAIPKQRTVGR